MFDPHARDRLRFVEEPPTAICGWGCRQCVRRPLTGVGTGRTLDCPMPPDCPTGQFDNRVVFYWLSDPNFPYATPATLDILRRAPLWALGYLDSPNRSAVPEESDRDVVVLHEQKAIT